MKPTYLEFCGIHSFSEKTVIDFRALLAGGVFGIFGNTGSGKSTILDCIHLALYGVIERSSGSMNDCLNYNVDSAYVIFDFEITIDGVRRSYRVRRERKRKNGTTKAALYEYAGDNLLALAEGTRDVNERLENIIGLSFNDFKMCIALPQGDFAALVNAPTSERVRLVSRLFDLEKYGERLAKAANEKYFEAERSVNLIKAQMEQNAGGSAEAIGQKQAETDEAKTALTVAEERYKLAETVYEKACVLQKEKQSYDEICRMLSTYEARFPQMDAMRKEAEKLPKAKLVKREADGLKTAQKNKAFAMDCESKAQADCQNATRLLEQAKEKYAARDFEEELRVLMRDLEKVNEAQKDLAEEEKTAAELAGYQAKYKALLEKCPAKDFAGIKSGLEKQLSELGEDESVLGYLKRNFKDVLQAETYSEIQTDLKNLSEKYPETQDDVDILLKKYTLKDGDMGMEMDISAIQLALKEAEQKRKALRKQLDEIAREEIAFMANETEKASMQKLGSNCRERYESLRQKNEQVKTLGNAKDLERKINLCKEEKRTLEGAVEKALERLNGFRAESEKQKGLVATYADMENSFAAALAAVLSESGFAQKEEAFSLLERLGDEERVQAECKAFFDKYALLKHKKEETDEKKFADYNPLSVELALAEKASAGRARDELNRKIAAYETELANLFVLQKRYMEFAKDLAEKEKRQKLCGELKELLRSNRFLEFIASEYLQEICVAASKTLLPLTGGRYFLRYDKEFKVGDNLEGGNFRGVKTLSGGETFLVSLSLALSLSGAICQKSLRPIEFFFLDEGFGTLDEELLDTVMNVLGKLSKSFSVGLISHVEELKHRIDNKLIVTGANEKHGSLVRMEKF